MKSRTHTLNIEGVAIQLAYKRVKHLRLVVSPPDGRVRVSGPAHLPEKVVHAFIRLRLDWIREKQGLYAGYIAPADPQFVTGERHYFQGRPYSLKLMEGAGRPRVAASGEDLIMAVKPGTDATARGRVLDAWYRAELKALVPGLLDAWQPRVGRTAAGWGIRKMRTRWGSCNIGRRRIWLNLELAKRPIPALEYVLVHELVHLLEAGHNPRFRAFMDGLLPDWRQRKQLLHAGMAPSGQD